VWWQTKGQKGWAALETRRQEENNSPCPVGGVQMQVRPGCLLRELTSCIGGTARWCVITSSSWARDSFADFVTEGQTSMPAAARRLWGLGDLGTPKLQQPGTFTFDDSLACACTELMAWHCPILDHSCPLFPFNQQLVLISAASLKLVTLVPAAAAARSSGCADSP
jgi:hypothetical protein